MPQCIIGILSGVFSLCHSTHFRLRVVDDMKFLSFLKREVIFSTSIVVIQSYKESDSTACEYVHTNRHRNTYNQRQFIPLKHLDYLKARHVVLKQCPNTLKYILLLWNTSQVMCGKLDSVLPTSGANLLDAWDLPKLSAHSSLLNASLMFSSFLSLMFCCAS